MTEHKEIQNPENYDERDYKKFDFLLFSDDTPVKVLEEIVMTLAHLPTKRAQDLLARFSKTDAAEQIEWLQYAIEEGSMHYYWPENDDENRDMVALKLYQRNENQIIELAGRCDSCEYCIKQYEIELEDLESLIKEKLSNDEQQEIDYRIIAVKDLIRIEKNRLYEATREMAFQEKLNVSIRANIKTPRYKDIDPREINGFHVDGEE